MKLISDLLRPYKGGVVGLSGLTDDLLVVYLKKIYSESKRNIVILTSTLFEATKLYQLLLKEVNNVLLYSMDDFLTSEALAISPDLKVSRLETINTIVTSNKKQIVLTHLMGFLRYLPEKSAWQKSIINIAKGSKIDKQDLINQFNNIGYTNETLVNKTGEIATRGYIVDIFPVNEINPIRIEFWGDQIDSIRYFELETQLSINDVDDLQIYPFDEFIADNVEEDNRKQKYLFRYAKTSKISDYLDDPVVVYIDYNQIKNAYTLLREDIFNYHTEHDSQIATDYMHHLEKISYDDEIYVMNIDNVISDVKFNDIDAYDVKKTQSYNSNFDQLNRDIFDYISFNKTVIICINGIDKINNFIKYLECNYVITDEDKIFANRLNIINKDLDHGYIFDKYIILSEKDIFKNTDNNAVYKSKFRYGTKIKDLTKLVVGDYVVHQIHGIGIYCGIETLIKNNVKKDYIQIKYKGNDKLYIPVEKIDLIWKYSSNEGLTPNVHQLGGLDWQKTKLKIRNRLHDIAKTLLKIAAEREATQGFPFLADNEEQHKFERDFAYDETKDQLIVTKQIKDDMEKRTPMDRLLCGDVGYGKTEVAFRAIFKAIQSGKQVAFLCPTTILSNQHYENAIERFKNFAVNIALLNRFTTPKETKAAIEGLANGKVDVVIGTHRLLSKDIKFKDIGLLVVDEEQRFGVSHKERIKEYKANIDVLTLTATPIPRTLQISMLGLRQLSLIETPPMNRFPIQTYVLEYNEHIVKDAIYKELSRNGQVFVLYNKVADIEDKANAIRRLVPDARVTFAHGQMPKQKIEDQMIRFINGEFDVLVCTTIIETGIDIPNVNTLIIMAADHFGLSQLYQIRGRVGRSNKIAYAYLMYNKNKVLSEIAVKRLNVIKEFTALGSGFSIALRDLSIRGAGDILGDEQAGFIDSVGIELYLKMLNEEVSRIKGIHSDEDIREEVDEKPLIDIETHISDEYVKETDLKIEIHRKINKIDSIESLNVVKNELEDRFGKISEAMQIYMYEEWFEKIAKEKGVERVDQAISKIELIFTKEKSRELIAKEIFNIAINISSRFSVIYRERRLRVILNTKDLDKHWLYFIIKFTISI